jgi:hypothetical protein
VHFAADFDVIRKLNRLAFGGNDEAEIVDRTAGLVLVITE